MWPAPQAGQNFLDNHLIITGADTNTCIRLLKLSRLTQPQWKLLANDLDSHCVYNRVIQLGHILEQINAGNLNTQPGQGLADF